MRKTGNPVEMIDARGPGAFDQLRKLEQVSAQIFYSQPMYLPGVLQSEGYAREMISGISGSVPESGAIAERMQLRMSRAAAFRERLDGDESPQVWAVIDESVFRRTRNAEAMREQIDHLIELSKKDPVHLGILPLTGGPTVCLGGTFEVHEIAGGQASVFFEGGPQDEIVGTDQARAGHYRGLVEKMLASAATDAEAESLLSEIRNSL
jgi:hypothetical protein